VIMTRTVLKIRKTLRLTGFMDIKTRTAPKKIQTLAALNARVLQPGQTLLSGVIPYIFPTIPAKHVSMARRPKVQVSFLNRAVSATLVGISIVLTGDGRIIGDLPKEKSRVKIKNKYHNLRLSPCFKK
jgi:hypothetical protein